MVEEQLHFSPISKFLDSWGVWALCTGSGTYSQLSGPGGGSTRPPGLNVTEHGWDEALLADTLPGTNPSVQNMEGVMRDPIAQSGLQTVKSLSMTVLKQSFSTQGTPQTLPALSARSFFDYAMGEVGKNSTPPGSQNPFPSHLTLPPSLLPLFPDAVG